MSGDSSVGLIFSAFVGPLLLLIGFFIWIRTRQFIARSQQVQATVIRMVYNSGSNGGGYAPIFEFKTLNGETIQVTEKLYTNPPQFQTGQVVDVIYDPEKPSRARVNKWFNLYFAPMLLAGLGFIFFVVGILVSLPSLLNKFGQFFLTK